MRFGGMVMGMRGQGVGQAGETPRDARGASPASSVADARESLAGPVALIVSYALMSGWATLDVAGDAGVVASSWPAGQLLQICVRASMAVCFLVAAALAARAVDVSRASGGMPLRRACLVAIVAFAVLLVGSWRLPALALPAVACKGVAFALFMAQWLAMIPPRREATFLVLLFATSLGNFVYAGVIGIDAPAPLAALVIMPLLAVLVLSRAGDGGALAPVEAAAVRVPLARAAARDRRSEDVSVLLCVLAVGFMPSGPASQTDASTYVVALVTLAVGVWLVLARPSRPERLFAGLVLAACACVVLVLLLPDGACWPRGLSSACLWMVMLYSITWFATGSRDARGALGARSLAGLALVYGGSVLAEALGRLLDGHMACVATLVLLVVALTVALLGAVASMGRGSGDEGAPDAPRAGDGAAAGDDDGEGAPGRSPDASVLVAIGARHGLSPSELEVFEYLARGYSLKRVSERMAISESTAKYHRHNVYVKLGIASRQELIDLVERGGEDADARDGASARPQPGEK